MFDGGSCMSHPNGTDCGVNPPNALSSTASDVFYLSAQQHQQHDQDDTQKQTVLRHSDDRIEAQEISHRQALLICL